MADQRLTVSAHYSGLQPRCNICSQTQAFWTCRPPTSNSDTCMTCFLGLYSQNPAGRQPCLSPNPLLCPCQLALKSREPFGLLDCCLFIQMIFRKALPLPVMTLTTGGSAPGDQGDPGWILGPSEQRKKLGTVVLGATERKLLTPLFLDPPAQDCLVLLLPKNRAPSVVGM